MSNLTWRGLTLCAGLALLAGSASAQYRPTGIGPSPGPKPQREWRGVGPYDRSGPSDWGRDDDRRDNRDRYDRDRYDRDRYDRDWDDHDHHHDHDHDRDWDNDRRPGDGKSGKAFGPFGVVIDYGPGKVVLQPKSVIVQSDDRDNRGQFRYGCRHIPQATIKSRGEYVRKSYKDRDVFTTGWYDSHRTAWRPRRYTNRDVYASASWNSVRDFCRVRDTRPVYYDYGRSVIYNNDMVYVNGSPTVAINTYFDQAAQIADLGRRARVLPDDQWQSLGVFALVREDQTWAATDYFQVAINEQGILRGNYYNSRTGDNQPLYGAVDLRTQRAVWTLADNLTPLYDTGLANLTQGETVMMAHFDRSRSGQYLLIRVQQPY